MGRVVVTIKKRGRLAVLLTTLKTTWKIEREINKAGYAATPVACGWAGAVFEVTWSFGQEQWGQKPQKPKESKVWRTDGRTDKAGCRVTSHAIKKSYAIWPAECHLFMRWNVVAKNWLNIKRCSARRSITSIREFCLAPNDRELSNSLTMSISLEATISGMRFETSSKENKNQVSLEYVKKSKTD